MSTLLRRARLRGNPPATHEMASTRAGAAGAFMRTGQVASASMPRPSDTRTRMVADAGGVMPVDSKLTVAPVPAMRPAVALHA